MMLRLDGGKPADIHILQSHDPGLLALNYSPTWRSAMLYNIGNQLLGTLRKNTGDIIPDDGTETEEKQRVTAPGR